MLANLKFHVVNGSDNVSSHMKMSIIMEKNTFWKQTMAFW